MIWFNIQRKPSPKNLTRTHVLLYNPGNEQIFSQDPFTIGTHPVGRFPLNNHDAADEKKDWSISFPQEKKQKDQ